MATRTLASFSLNLASHENCLGSSENVLSRPRHRPASVIHRPLKRADNALISLKRPLRLLEAQSKDQPARLRAEMAKTFEPSRRWSRDLGYKISCRLVLLHYAFNTAFYRYLTAYAPRVPKDRALARSACELNPECGLAFLSNSWTKCRFSMDSGPFLWARRVHRDLAELGDAYQVFRGNHFVIA